MATLVHPSEGRVRLLVFLPTPTRFYMRLYQNDYSPVASTVLGDLTEATFNGYSAQDALFGTPYEDGNGDGAMESAVRTWTKSAGGTANTIYGIYVTCDDGSGPKCFVAQRFDSPVSMSATGATIVRQIRFLQGQYPIT